jgi:DNA processing protein
MPQQLTTEEKCLIAMTMLPGVGPVSITKIIEALGSAEAFFALSENNRHSLLRQKPDWAALRQMLDAEIKFISASGIDVLFPGSEKYPKLLKECADAPYALYAKGSCGLASKRYVSIVGTRTPSQTGKKKIDAIIEALAPYKPVIISGMAAGIDTYAHWAALENGLATVGVMGNSLKTIYPASNKKLAEKICGQGCLLSEFYSAAGVDKMNFVRRNRIIAGMSEAVIVAESKSKGGALLTADYAINYGRDVFALPGDIFDEKTSGCNDLIRLNKAGLASTGEHIAVGLNWKSSRPRPAPAQAQLALDISPEELHIVELLRAKGKLSLDSISETINMPIGKIQTSLLSLQLNRIIKSMPGNSFEIS